MFHRAKGRPARSSPSDVGGVRLAEQRASGLENCAGEYEAPLDERFRTGAYKTRAYQLYLESYLERGTPPNGEVRDWRSRSRGGR